MDHPDYMTPEDAGRYLGPPGNPIPATTLQWWRTKGRGPRYFKVGRKVIYARRDLDDFREAGKRSPENQEA